jgi:hypothetical protein
MMCQDGNMGLNMIGTRVIRTKRGIQWDRSQIRASQKGLGTRREKD